MKRFDLTKKSGAIFELQLELPFLFGFSWRRWTEMGFPYLSFHLHLGPLIVHLELRRD